MISIIIIFKIRKKFNLEYHRASHSTHVCRSPINTHLIAVIQAKILKLHILGLSWMFRSPTWKSIRLGSIFGMWMFCICWS